MRILNLIFFKITNYEEYMVYVAYGSYCFFHSYDGYLELVMQAIFIIIKQRSSIILLMHMSNLKVLQGLEVCDS